jgi:hypothetical protein
MHFLDAMSAALMGRFDLPLENRIQQVDDAANLVPVSDLDDSGYGNEASGVPDTRVCL